jgi:DNA (cytosine-5)-methyltransferase 1
MNFRSDCVKLKLLSLFSGIGAPEVALRRLGIDYELVGFSEVDKHAIKAYCAIQDVDESLNLGDISRIDEEEIPSFDLMTFGFPCTDLSAAGKQKGIILQCRDCNSEFVPVSYDKGCPNCESKHIHSVTPSGLIFDALRILAYHRPKYFLAENVKNLVQKKFKDDFEKIIEYMESLGYNVSWQVLNAKDFLVPQNRERVFIVGTQSNLGQAFTFPQTRTYPNYILDEVAVTHERNLSDVTELNVEERYYVATDRTEELVRNSPSNVPTKPGVYGCSLRTRSYRGQPQQLEVRKDGLSNTITSVQKDSLLLEVLEDDAELPILHNIYGGFKEDKPRVFTEYSPTIRTAKGGGHIPFVCTSDESRVEKVIGKYRIRKLTPLETMRLMDFDDEDYFKIKEIGISNTQIYNMAGNSIVVAVLEEIFKNLLREKG